MPGCGPHDGGRGVGLALCRVARNVGRCDEGLVEKAAVDAGLVLPDIDHHTLRCLDECAVSATSPRAAFMNVASGRMRLRRRLSARCRVVSSSGVCQGEDVGLGRHLFYRQEIAAFALLPRRVASQYAESPHASVLFDKASDMTHADDAESLLLRLPPLVGGEGRKCRSDPLQHPCGVAPLCRHDLYAVRGAIVEVDMVEAYCGGRYEPYARALQKASVAARARADDEHVGIDGIFMRDIAAGRYTTVAYGSRTPDM